MLTYMVPSSLSPTSSQFDNLIKIMNQQPLIVKLDTWEQGLMKFEYNNFHSTLGGHFQ